MKKLLLIPLVLVAFAAGYFSKDYLNRPEVKIPILKPTPLAKYTIENLSKTTAPASEIVMGDALTTDKNFTSSVFTMTFDPSLSGQAPKKVTGVITTPTKPGKYPVVVMFRGFVDQTIYQPGTGTKKDAEYFAKNGFITIAPDFLGYGGSDKEAGDIFEARFQTYTTAMTVLSSVKNIPGWDNKNIYIWGHSNGGQIALTTLEITGVNYPTVLWAPVSKPFPFSILFFSDVPGDYGKYLRGELAKFESDYNSDLFSIHMYFNQIKAPLLIEQGTADESVPVAWSNTLVATLKSLKVNVKYDTYPGADHNLQPSWNLAIGKSLTFFKSH
jgi:dipeptidyl aminopeptidase/acylaminoacyl peptidase